MASMVLAHREETPRMPTPSFPRSISQRFSQLFAGDVSDGVSVSVIDCPRVTVSD